MVRDLPTQIAVADNQAWLQREHAKNMDLCDAEIEQYLQTVPDISDEEALNLLFEQSEDERETNEAGSREDFKNLLDAVVTNLGENESGFAYDIVGVHRAEHTLQLCVSDSLTKLSKGHKNVIELARRAAKTLRLKSTCDEMRAVCIKFAVPNIENATRWGSLFMMVRTLDSYYRLKKSICFKDFNLFPHFLAIRCSQMQGCYQLL